MKRTVKQHIHNNTVIYCFESELPPLIDLRLKAEADIYRYFSALRLKQLPFQVTNSWFIGKCNLTYYELEELLGTKLLALYRRCKRRNLFDLYWAMRNNDTSRKTIPSS